MATLSAYVRLDDFGETLPFSSTENGYELELSNNLYLSDVAYREIKVLLRFTPEKENSPAPFVSVMEIELPVLLRAWSPSEIKIDTAYFSGSGEQTVYNFEITKNLSAQSDRLIGSMLLLRHYEKTGVSPTFSRVKRTSSVALEAARIIATSNTGNWFQPSNALLSYVTNSFPGNREYIILLEQLSGIPLKDLNAIEQNKDFLSLSCVQLGTFFTFLEAIFDENASAAALYLNSSKSLLDNKRNVLAKKMNC